MKHPEKYLDNGYVEKLYSVDKNGKKSDFSLIEGPTNLCRGVVYITNSSQQQILQLRDNTFYVNALKEDNNQYWIRISSEYAINEITKKQLKPLVITGGIKKFFGLNLPGDKPEVTLVNLEESKIKTLKR